MFVVLVDMLNQQSELRLKIAELEAQNEEQKQSLLNVAASAQYWLNLLNSGCVYWRTPDEDKDEQEKPQEQK